MKKGETIFTMGNDAMTAGAIAAGARFYAGYPITPSSEVAELSSVRLPQVGGLYVQMEDELGSMAAIIGASAAGKKSYTATSGPGFSLMQENLGVAVMGEIPCVIVDVMRSGPSTGMATKPAQGDLLQAKWGTHGDHGLIVISPASVQECYDYMITAFNYSEKHRTPVVFLADEVVGHMRERLDMPEPGELPVVERLRTSVKAGVNYYPYLPREDGRLPMSDFGGVHRYNVTGLYHDIWGFPTEQPETVNKLLYHLVDKIEAKAAEIARWKEYFLDDAQQVFVSYGSAARSALHLVHTLRGKGIRAGLLELQTLWPFPAELVRDRTEGARNVYVVEMNMGHIMAQVRQAAWKPDRVFLVNRVDGQLITPTDIGKVMRVIEGRGF